MKGAKAIWIFILLIFLAIFGGFVWFLLSSYDTIIDFAAQQLKRPDLKNILTTKYFTPEKYKSLKAIGRIAIHLSGLLVALLCVKRKIIISFIDTILIVLKKRVSNFIFAIKNSNSQIKIGLGVLLLLVLARSIYYALHFYPNYDECWNYNYFLSNQPFTTLVAYNNYPLHNLISYAFLTVLPDNTFVMRLPNIILGLGNLLLVFVIAKKLFQNEKIALAAAAVFSVLPTVVFYMLFARGIMLSLFFAIILFYYFFVKTAKEWSTPDTILIIIAGGLGCYSMISFPIFIIVLFAVFIVKYAVQKNWFFAKKLIISGAGILLFTAFLYAPFLLGSGVDLAINSSCSQRISFDGLIEKAAFVSRNQIGFYSGAYLFLAISIILLFIHKRKTLIVFNLILLLLPFLLSFFIKTQLPARALSFQILAYLFTLVILLEYLLKYTNRYIFIGGSIFILAFWNYTSTNHTFFDWSARPDKETYKIAQILKQENIKTYYDQSGNFQYFVPGILYHSKLNKNNTRFFSSNKKSARYIASEDYKGNCFVEQKENFTKNENRKILFQTEEFILYRFLNR